MWQRGIVTVIVSPSTFTFASSTSKPAFTTVEYLNVNSDLL